MKLLIPVASGLEQTTKRQLLFLGFEKAPADNGRLEMEGDWQDIARLNVFLRSGERVLIVLDKFHAVTFDELYEGIYAIPWENWLTVESKILMDGMNTVCTNATPHMSMANDANAKSRKKFSTVYAVIQNTTPITLKYRCARAARFAFLLAPRQERSAVTQVPMFCPITIGIAAP